MTLSLRCILLIDDNLADNYLHRWSIRSLGGVDQVEERTSGDTALAWLQTLREEEWPELIFLDINMPGMDGWEFLDHYQQLDARCRDRSKLIFLSASADPEEIRRAQKDPRVAGMMPKPLDEEALRGLLGNT
jgi:CheY-like chemotaxis protein